MLRIQVHIKLAKGLSSKRDYPVCGACIAVE